MNTIKFKQVMLANNDTQKELADALGLSQSGISDRINGNVDFRQSEINQIILRYKLNMSDVREIFFDQEVS